MLQENYIQLDVDKKSKEDILDYISNIALKNEVTDNQSALYQDFMDREKEFPTGLADGFAIPHARTDNVKKIAVMFIRNKTGIEWGSLDDQKVNYLFALLVPQHYEGNVHLQMISKLAACLLEDDFKETIKLSSSKAELKEYILTKMEEEEA